ncbi:MAG: RagB/SusD family nutrient uptake outer membrane protein [Bacteroidota bacterium]
MKKLLYIFLLGGILLTSCDDLDVENKAALPQDVVLADTDGFEAVLFAAYESVNDFGYYGQTMMIGPEILADNMDLVQLTGRYEQEFVNALNSGINIWFNRYTAINECNIVINLINDEEVAGTQEVKNQFIAEAKFLRALFYHDLARVYGYEPGQEVNGFNSAVILRTEPTLGLSDADDRARATNEDVYAQIEQDLLDAIADLPEAGAGSSAVARANKDAARLLLARVYLYWGKNGEAANYAQQVVAGDGSDLVAAADYEGSWDDANFSFHPESVFESDLQVPDWNSVDGANNSLHSLLMNDTGGSQFIITASDELIAEIESQAGDVRRDLFNTEALGEEFAKWQGNKGTVPFQENIPILRLSEGYLIAAEALGAGAGDPFLNALRTSRGLAGGVSATVDNVLREKRIEFMAEGHRWFDLKRLGRDIPKPASASTDDLPYSDFKILPRLPQSELELSEGNLVQNPGYN